jgi:hypothetical protein
MWRKIAVYPIALIPILAVIVFVSVYGMSGYPYADTTIANGDTAILAHDNTLTLNDLFTPHYRHRVVFTRLTTALLTEIRAWDVRYEVILTVVLGVINCGLITSLLWRFWGKSAPVMLIITTALVMNLDQAVNWLSGLQTSWQFVLCFSLITIRLSQHPKWWGFMGAVISGLCATLSLGNGIVIWAVLIIVLWLSGNRAYWRYGIILAMGGIFALVTLKSGLSIAGNQYNAPQFADIPEIIRLGLVMISRPIASNITYSPIPDTPQVVYFASVETTLWLVLPALLGMGIFAYTTWTMYRRDGFKPLAVPLGIMIYACGSIGMIAIITVLQSLADHTDNTILALNERYLPLSLLFWLIVISISAVHITHAHRAEKIGFSLILVILLGLHINTLITEIPYISFNELAFPLDDPQKNGECAKNYPLTGDRTCIYAEWMTDWDNLDQLAHRRLAGYAHLPMQTVIPHFGADDGVILNSESAWQSLHLRDYFLGTIPHEAIFHLAPTTDDNVLANIQHSPNPPHALWLGDAPASHEALTTFLGDKNGVWYVVRPPLYMGEALPAFRGDIEAQFVPAGYVITPENIQITRYIRPFATTQPQANFGDITLMGWQFANKADFGACDTVVIQSAWQTTHMQSQTIHLSLALVDMPITRAVINTDSPLSPIPVQFWEVDNAYYDERRLTIPCDLPSGDYALTLTLYGITDGGEILPNLPISTTSIAFEGHLLVIEPIVIP